MRYEPTISDHQPEGDRLFRSVGAVMGEIAALLDERRSGQAIRAREVLAGHHRSAAERRKARREAQGAAAGPAGERRRG